MHRLLLEVCAGSADDAFEAQAGGADRVELNSALFEGGLTPSLGTLIETRRQLKIPLLCMIRPRSGGFCYTRNELAAMERDAELALEHGADGLVFGCLRSNGRVDARRNLRFVKLAGRRATVFHRAFDVTPDPFIALEELVDMGVTRVLTSGQEASAYQGCALLRRLIRKARGRIEILPGGGINAFSLADILKRTGARQVHVSARRELFDRSAQARPQVRFGGALMPAEDCYSRTDRAAVKVVRGMLGGVRATRPR